MRPFRPDCDRETRWPDAQGSCATIRLRVSGSTMSGLSQPVTVLAVGGVHQGRYMATEFQVTFDGAKPAAHAAFWAEALHYVQPRPPLASIRGTPARRLGCPGRRRPRGFRRPRRCRAAAVLPEGARVEDCQEPRGP